MNYNLDTFGLPIATCMFEFIFVKYNLILEANEIDFYLYLKFETLMIRKQFSRKFIVVITLQKL